MEDEGLERRIESESLEGGVEDESLEGRVDADGFVLIVGNLEEVAYVATIDLEIDLDDSIARLDHRDGSDLVILVVMNVLIV
jgi:hypothetical protein